MASTLQQISRSLFRVCKYIFMTGGLQVSPDSQNGSWHNKG